MGDWTQGWARVRGGVGPEQAADVLAALEDAGYAWDDRYEYGPLGRRARERGDDEIDWSAADFTGESVTGDASSEVVAAITGLCPSARVWAQTDPAYEWLGVVAIHTPELGLFIAEGDADGQARFTADEVLAWVREGLAGQPAEALTAFLEERMGVPWTRAIFPPAPEAPEPGPDGDEATRLRRSGAGEA